MPDGTGSVYGDTDWYLVVLSHYKLLLLGTWYRVSLMLFMPVNIEKSGDLVGCY